jgi:outer membrane immunogenic protein
LIKQLLIAATSTAALAAAAPAFAQDPWAVTTTYGTLGYTDYNNDDGANVGAVTARLGARFDKYLGVEGEFAGGVSEDHFNDYGGRIGERLNDEVAAYGVGYLPLASNADLFARVGYADNGIHLSDNNTSATNNENSWNFGVGGQYFFDGKDGLRLDYTRSDAMNSAYDSNVWSVAYVRKF